MDMTPDQMVEFLVGAFKDIERETLLLVLQANDYKLEAALEALISMESADRHVGDEKLKTSIAPICGGGISSSISRRGAKVSLPNDFLRIPGWNRKHQEQLNNQDIMNLCTDPIFLRELEREFGPDYEAVLREHLQAESLRLIASNSTRSAPPPYTAYGQPVPYRSQQIHQQQQHQRQLQQQQRQQEEPRIHAPAPPSSLYFFSPPQPTQPSDPRLMHQMGSRPMEGFGGGVGLVTSPGTSASNAPSISDRFQSVLRSFMSPTAKENGSSDEARGLLTGRGGDDEDEEGEEGQWEGGVQMQQVGSTNRDRMGGGGGYADEEEDDDEGDARRTLLRMRAEME